MTRMAAILVSLSLAATVLACASSPQEKSVSTKAAVSADGTCDPARGNEDCGGGDTWCSEWGWCQAGSTGSGSGEHCSNGREKGNCCEGDTWCACSEWNWCQ